MKSSLVPGVTRTVRIIVDEPRTIDFMGEECRVYATPNMIRDIENVCRDLLLEHSDEGESSVGRRIELDHVLPTLIGMPVDITAKVAEVNGRLVTFEVEARDSLEVAGRGRHVRFIVDVATTTDRLRRKRAEAQGAQG